MKDEQYHSLYNNFYCCIQTGGKTLYFPTEKQYQAHKCYFDNLARDESTTMTKAIGCKLLNHWAAPRLKKYRVSLPRDEHIEPLVFLADASDKLGSVFSSTFPFDQGGHPCTDVIILAQSTHKAIEVAKVFKDNRPALMRK